MPRPAFLCSKPKWRVVVLWMVATCVISILGGCTGFAGSRLPTPFPTEYLPTAIALTADAAHFPAATPLPPASPSATILTTEAPVTVTPFPMTPTPAYPILPTGSPSASTDRIPGITATLNPDIPNAEIQFLGMGPLSKVTSPIHLSTYIRTIGSGRVIVELLGEDKRLLFREVRAIGSIPAGAWIPLNMEIDFEVAAVAEAGRLQISIEDDSKRITALNSLPLILLSIGQPDILPALDIQAPIVIQKPGKKALIQGGKVLVSGLVRGTADQPILVKLLNSKGGEVGARIASVQFPTDGGYGTFQVEVSYTVNQWTEALLVVTQGESGITDVIHLTSLDVILAP